MVEKKKLPKWAIVLIVVVTITAIIGALAETENDKLSKKSDNNNSKPTMQENESSVYLNATEGKQNNGVYLNTYNVNSKEIKAGKYKIVDVSGKGTIIIYDNADYDEILFSKSSTELNVGEEIELKDNNHIEIYVSLKIELKLQ